MIATKLVTLMSTAVDTRKQPLTFSKPIAWIRFASASSTSWSNRARHSCRRIVIQFASGTMIRSSRETLKYLPYIVHDCLRRSRQSIPASDTWGLAGAYRGRTEVF
jgi:hypothetical protein